MAENLNVDPERVRAHASNVEKLAAPLGQALEAAKAVSAPTEAFGKICAFLPPLFVDSVETDGIAALEAAVAAVGADAGKLRTVADGYESTDSSNASKLKAVEPNGPAT